MAPLNPVRKSLWQSFGKARTTAWAGLGSAVAWPGLTCAGLAGLGLRFVSWAWAGLTWPAWWAGLAWAELGWAWLGAKNEAPEPIPLGWAGWARLGAGLAGAGLGFGIHQGWAADSQRS